MLAPFAAVAGLLGAAERRGAVVRSALQVGADAAAEIAGVLDWVGGDVACEAVRVSWAKRSASASSLEPITSPQRQ